MKKFSEFLLNEQSSYLGRRVGDVLTAMQDTQDHMPNLGTRHLSKIAEDIVNQIRKILHGSWSPKNQNELKELQKIGVAIMKTIDEKGDLKQILPAATQQMQIISGKLGMPVNDLKAPQMPGEDINQSDFQITSNTDGPIPQSGPNGTQTQQMNPAQGGTASGASPQGSPTSQAMGAQLPGMSQSSPQG